MRIILASYGLRTAVVRLHGRRSDAVSACRHGGGGMERDHARARCVEGVAAARVSQLFGGLVGPQGSRRAARARRPRVADRIMILAGDIGGTSTRLAVFELRHNALRAVVEHTYASRAHPGLREIVSRFV